MLDKGKCSVSKGSPSEHHKGWLLHSWLYRCKLISGTIVLIWLLSGTQLLFYNAHSHLTAVQDVIRWVEVIWVLPIPIVVVWWVSWLFFAQAAHPDPYAVRVPLISLDQNHVAPPLLRPARLIFRFVTRGENVNVLYESIYAVYEAFARYSAACGPYRIEIVSERPLNFSSVAKSNTSVYLLPPDYVAPHGSRFKARALTYLQEQTKPQPEDWHIYLDEESTIDEVFLAGIYHFILQSEVQMCQPNRHFQGIIGQGTIIYQGGLWFFRGADAIRTAHDIGYFRLQFGLGIPFCGFHGSFIVVRARDEMLLSFDVGPKDSITEDVAWALRAWARGFRFVWINGYLYEQPPQTVQDFIKQRSRWLIGARLVLGNKTLHWRYRWCLAIFTYLWNLTPISFAISLFALFTAGVAFSWIQIPANFVWVVLVLAYSQGAYLQMQRTAQFFTKKEPSMFQLMKMQVLSCLLTSCVFLYIFLEILSVVYGSLHVNQGFYVINKPSLKRYSEQ